jgi:hypothetical protein
MQRPEQKRNARQMGSDVEDVSVLRQKCHSLEAEVRSKDIRLEALHDQLVKSSQEAAREIASLRMKIFDLEMTGGGSSVGDPDEFDPVKSRSSQTKMLIPYSNMMEEKSSRGSTASSNAYADLGGKVFGRSNKTPEPSSPLQPASEASAERYGKQEHSDKALGLARQRSREQALAPTAVAGYPPRNKPYMEHAYRPDSTTGSPRPVSPSEASDMQSFAGSPRMPSKFPMASARSRAGGEGSDVYVPSRPREDMATASPGNRQPIGVASSRQPTSRSRQSPGESPNKDVNSPFYSDILQTLARDSSENILQTLKPPPLGDLSSLSHDSNRDLVDVSVSRKHSINSIRSSRSAGSVHSNHHA